MVARDDFPGDGLTASDRAFLGPRSLPLGLQASLPLIFLGDGSNGNMEIAKMNKHIN